MRTDFHSCALSLSRSYRPNSRYYGNYYNDGYGYNNYYPSNNYYSNDYYNDGYGYNRHYGSRYGNRYVSFGHEWLEMLLKQESKKRIHVMLSMFPPYIYQVRPRIQQDVDQPKVDRLLELQSVTDCRHGWIWSF